MKTVTQISKCIVLVGLLLLSSNAIAQPFFYNKIPIPPVLDASAGPIYLEMRTEQHLYNPLSADPNDSLNGGAGYPGVESWCYNLAGDSTMTTLGPTLKWTTGDSVNIYVKNLLPSPTTTHWHGAELPAKFDGGPHQPIPSDSTWSIHITDLDSASTMWYHPHYHNDTYRQVQYGLSGLIISEQTVDPIRAVLPSTYGADDFPVIIGDQFVGFDQPSNQYAIYPGKHRRPTNIVNGVTNPYLEVPAHMVQLRILNGSTRKGIHFGISASGTSMDPNDLEDFVLVGMDGGYAIDQDTMTNLTTGPGARSIMLLDLTSYSPGDVLYLRNLKGTMHKSIIGSALQPTNNPNLGPDTTGGDSFLQLRIVADNQIPVPFTPVNAVPAYTSNWTPDVADTNAIDKVRVKTLEGAPGQGFTIDGNTYVMMTINDTVCVNTTEVWEIINETTVSHPFHIHKIFFRVLTARDSSGALMDLRELGWNGPKDDILIRPHWKVRFMAAFDDFPNAINPMLSYMYHCHILTHEDSLGGGMMHQFVVTDEGPCYLGLDENEFGQEMLLYPNPTTNELFLKGTSQANSSIRIIDLQGNLVHTQKLPSFEGETSIDIKKVSTGLYIFQWDSIEGTVTKKLMIE